MTKMAQRQGLVTIKDIPGNWAQKTGGTVSADVTPVWDGGAEFPEMLSSPASVENVTVTRPFDDQRDLPEIKRLRRLAGRFITTITDQPTNADLFPIGEPDVYPNALLLSVTTPEVNAASGDAKEIQLVFACPRVV